MPRPRRMRRVRFMPGFTQFGPTGVRKPEISLLSMGEFEAIRLNDHEGLDQEKAAKKMNVSQPTFNRILKSARKKIADSLVSGKLIRIEGGDYKMVTPRGGRMGGFGDGPSGKCLCSKCGHKVPHQRGVPCYKQKCPKCGTMMTRG